MAPLTSGAQFTGKTTTACSAQGRVGSASPQAFQRAYARREQLSARRGSGVPVQFRNPDSTPNRTRLRARHHHGSPKRTINCFSHTVLQTLGCAPAVRLHLVLQKACIHPAKEHGRQPAAHKRASGLEHSTPTLNNSFRLTSHPLCILISEAHEAIAPARVRHAP